MKFTLEIKEEALNDISVAFHFYEEKRAGLGENFISVIDATFDKITENPLRYPLKYKKKRAAIVKKYPFIIIFDLVANMITIFAVFHTSRNPQRFES